MKRVLAAAIAYFASVFAVGFVLGVLRGLLLAPWLGERIAELLELPFMLLIIAWIAGKLWHKFSGLTGWQWLRVGAIALALMLATEFTLVLSLRGMTFQEYLASRDAVAFPAYLFSLLIFAILPAALTLYNRAHGRRHETHVS